MPRGGGPHALEAPRQSDVAAWARTVATARGADRIPRNGPQANEADRLTLARLGSLLFVARELYDELVCPVAREESRRMDEIIDHCLRLLPAVKALLQDPDFEYKPREVAEWTETQCQAKVRTLMVPYTFETMRPAPPNVIGVHMLPDSPEWRLLRTRVNLLNITGVDKWLRDMYGYQKRKSEIGIDNVESAQHPLHNARFVDFVLKRAPPLIRALPPPWTAPEKSDVLLEALIALLKMGRVRSFATLVKKLYGADYDLLVQEHFCLSQILDSGAWEPSCDNGRTLEEYRAFARFLQQNTGFKGLLGRKMVGVQPVNELRGQSSSAWTATSPPPLIPYPNARPIGGVAIVGHSTGAAQENNGEMELDMTHHTLQAPAQNDTAAWAQMLAAARVADLDDAQTADASRQIRYRLSALLPIARELYDKHLRPTVQAESENMLTVIDHCIKHLPAMKALSQELDLDYKPRAVAAWTKKQCRNEARKLLVPQTLETLRVAPADAIGLQLLPSSLIWRMFRVQMNLGMTRVDKRLRDLYGHQKRRNKFNRNRPKSALQPLHNLRFADAVLERAPPLVRALPPQWTAVAKSSQMVDALMALLKMGSARSWYSLVRPMCAAERDFLVREHSCLSEVLDSNAWSQICNVGRTLGEYRAFARFLRNSAGFKGLLARSPLLPQPESGQVETRSGSASPLLGKRPIDATAGIDLVHVALGGYSTGGEHPIGDGLDSPQAHPQEARPQEARPQEARPQDYRQKEAEDAVAWSRLLAAARGADLIPAEGATMMDVPLLTRNRLGALLPIARELYEANALQTAHTESQRIEEILEHCHQFARTMGSLQRDFGIKYPRTDAKPWDKRRCEREAHNLLIPLSLLAMKPAPRSVIGFHMIPQSPVWRQLRDEIDRNMLDVEVRLRPHYGIQKSQSRQSGHLGQSKLQLLHNVRFVDAVLERAPPLVRALPPPWTSPDMTDELLEALLAFLNVQNTRPLATLVPMLSSAERDLLAKEHDCLSQLLARRKWTPSCNDGRTLDEYLAFAQFLQPGKPSRSAAKRQRLCDGAHCAAAGSVNGFSADSIGIQRDGSLSAMEDWDRELSEPLERNLAEPLHHLNKHDPADVAANDAVELLWTMPETLGAAGDISLAHGAGISLQPAVGLTMHGDAAIAKGSVAPLAVTGAVVAFGLVLLISALVVRFRSRRSAN